MSSSFQQNMVLATHAFQAGNIVFAETRAQAALSSNPRSADALHMLGVIRGLQNNHAEAERFLKKAAQLEKRNKFIFFNLAKALSEQGKNAESINWHKKALALDPMDAMAWLNYGKSLFELDDIDCASEAFDRAIFINMDLAAAYTNKANCLNKNKFFEEALKLHDHALTLDSNLAEAWNNRGSTLNDLLRHEDALASFNRCIELKPDFAEAWSNRGVALDKLKHHEEAAISYFNADSLRERKVFDFGRAHHQMMLCCNWTNYAFYTERINEGIERGEFLAEPFGYQGIAESESLLKICAENYCNVEFPAKLGAFSFNRRTRKPKIKIGYLCGEFRDQATCHLMAGVWEHHDSSKFEFFALDNGWDDNSDYRKRTKAAFHELFDISALTDLEVATFISENEIDILVNLNGYFGKARQRVFALKPTPISINYLGFPGTIGASYIDYMMADRIVIPEESIEFYKEKIIFLPFTYQANDDRREISKRPFVRTDFGLPENHFIFCCFNNNYKITPRMFSTWMGILRAVSESSLWLLEDNTAARKNLIAEAVSHDINPNRLIFANRISAPENLRRQELADLFLDTLPYNAHTTASDALWAGLPLLTLKGQTFPGRVGASLLSAVGLPELVTDSYEHYANVAIELANNPDWLASLRSRLAKNRASCNLFNTAMFTRHIEEAYETVYDRHHEGLPPDHVYVGA